VIPFDKYRKFLQTDANEVLRRFDRLRQRMAEVNARYPDEEVEKDLVSHRARRAAKNGTRSSRRSP
jgi:hypothetical protein